MYSPSLLLSPYMLILTYVLLYTSIVNNVQSFPRFPQQPKEVRLLGIRLCSHLDWMRWKSVKLCISHGCRPGRFITVTRCRSRNGVRPWTWPWPRQPVLRSANVSGEWLSTARTDGHDLQAMSAEDFSPLSNAIEPSYWLTM